MLYGLLIGLAVGMVVSLFRISIEGLSDQFLKLAKLARTNIFLLITLIILNLLIAFFVYYLVKRDKNIKGSGIPQVEGQLNGELDYS